MIKKNYEKNTEVGYFSCYLGYWVDRKSYSFGKYEHRYSWDRHVRTFNEIRQNTHTVDDGIRVRGKRSGRSLPTWYDDPAIARVFGRSWKDYTKQRKQWG